MFPVMRPYDYQESRLRPSVIVQPKIDGVRVHFYKGFFYTKTGKIIHGLEDRLFALGHIPKRIYHVDCEASIPGVDFDTMSGILRSYDNVLKQKILLHVIDLPDPKQDQVTRLIRTAAYVRDLNKQDPRWKMIPYTMCHSTSDVKMWYHIYLNQGHEGIMIKNPWGKYVDCGTTRRSWDWMRIKPESDFDGVVVGYVEGKGKYQGTLGLLIIKRLSNGDIVRCGCGKLTDKDRDIIWNNRPTFTGRRCSVIFQRRTAAGGYRHPRFSRWRLDI